MFIQFLGSEMNEGKKESDGERLSFWETKICKRKGVKERKQIVYTIRTAGMV